MFYSVTNQWLLCKQCCGFNECLWSNAALVNEFKTNYKISLVKFLPKINSAVNLMKSINETEFYEYDSISSDQAKRNLYLYISYFFEEHSSI